MEYAMSRHADDLDAVLHALQIESAHIVGSSWGAYVALFLALRQPDLVRTLVLGEPPILPLLRRSPAGRNLLEQFQKEIIQPSRTGLHHGNGEDGVRMFVDGVSGRSGSFDALPADARERLLLSAEELRKELGTPLEAYMPDLTMEALHALTLPVLLLGGERSPKMFRLITDELDLAIPTAERVLVPRAGHIVHSGNPEAFFNVVGQFLHRHGRGHHMPDSR
jgi:pimeloyl-ACP methyl ester carboxylesterase